jgi:hypothetical protein
VTFWSASCETAIAKPSTDSNVRMGRFAGCGRGAGQFATKPEQSNALQA